MEHDAFRVPYLSDKISDDEFNRQAVKTVAYLRVPTAQQDVRSQRLAIIEYARKHDFRPRPRSPRSITGVSRTALYSFMSTRGLRPKP